MPIRKNVYAQAQNDENVQQESLAWTIGLIAGGIVFMEYKLFNITPCKVVKHFFNAIHHMSSLFVRYFLAINDVWC